MRRRAKGFTLIEVMVAMVLLAVVAGGLFSSLTVIGRAQNNAAAVDVAQAGARAAFEILSRDLRMAAAGTTDATVFAVNSVRAVQPTITVTNSSTGPDRLDLLLIDPSASATVTTSLVPGSTTIQVSDVSKFSVGDSVVVTDFTGAAMFTVAGLTSGAVPLVTVPTATNILPRTWAAGSMIFRVRPVAYYVDSQAFGSNDPMLMYDSDGPGPVAPQPLAEGIEDMQLALGFDWNGDGNIVNTGTAANDDEWVFNVANESIPATLASLKSLRVTIVGRPTSVVNGGIRGKRPAAEDRPAASAFDIYPRRTLKSEIAIRNFNL